MQVFLALLEATDKSGRLKGNKLFQMWRGEKKKRSWPYILVLSLLWQNTSNVPFLCMHFQGKNMHIWFFSLMST